MSNENKDQPQPVTEAGHIFTAIVLQAAQQGRFIKDEGLVEMYAYAKKVAELANTGVLPPSLSIVRKK